MSKHTPGPWWIRYGYLWSGSITVAKVLQSTGPADEYEDRTPIENHEANAERIVACVNAMVGIEEPGSFVEHARRLHERVAKESSGGGSGVVKGVNK